MTRSLALFAYLTLSRLAAPLAPMLLRRRLRRGKEDADRLAERLGHAAQDRPEGRVIWLHGASVGEAVSILPLMRALQTCTKATFLVTTGTVTSARRMAHELSPPAVHQYVPLDIVPAVERFLDHWRPDLAIWVESELWPALVHETASRGIPMALVNGRLSQKSAQNWGRLPGMASRIIGAFSLIWTQDAESAERIRALGGQARFAGNLKALVPPPPVESSQLRELQTALGARPVWFAASTHPGEEQAIAEAHKRILRTAPATLLILAPRHPERADEVAEILRSSDLKVARRASRDPVGGAAQVLLADTMGEMGLWYRLAKVTFVAGSLVKVGGHTPFEPTTLGSAIVHGPHIANFVPAYAALAAQDAALEIGDAETLAVGVQALLEEPAARTRMTLRARVVQKGLGPDLEELCTKLLALMEASR